MSVPRCVLPKAATDIGAKGSKLKAHCYDEVVRVLASDKVQVCVPCSGQQMYKVCDFGNTLSLFLTY